MTKVTVGLMAHRSEAGAFLPARQITRKFPGEKLNRDGLTPQEDKALSELAKIFAEAFREHKEKGIWPECNAE